jgi:hypothetical protein
VSHQWEQFWAWWWLMMKKKSTANEIFKASPMLSRALNRGGPSQIFRQFIYKSSNCVSRSRSLPYPAQIAKFSDSSISESTESSTDSNSSSSLAPKTTRLVNGYRSSSRSRSSSVLSNNGSFVSSFFELPNSDIISYLRRRHFTYTENESHFIIKMCPFCHPQKDSTDQFKLYIKKNQGVFHCHRCSSSGMFDIQYHDNMSFPACY